MTRLINLWLNVHFGAVLNQEINNFELTRQRRYVESRVSFLHYKHSKHVHLIAILELKIPHFRNIWKQDRNSARAP